MEEPAQPGSLAEAVVPPQRMPGPYRCPAEATLEVIHGRWKVPIIWHLFGGTKRFSQLRKAVSGVTQKMLTQQLRELERDGVVTRTVYAEVPPRVEYALTERGMSLRPVVDAMCKWGKGQQGA
jgi:DNA-binding HxlR family transcriptional regulator